jgi:hypothetical protein
LSPLAHATRLLTALTPRRRTATPLRCATHCALTLTPEQSIPHMNSDTQTAARKSFIPILRRQL